MKKVAVIICNYHIETRTKLIREVLSQKDAEIRVYCSDFHHSKKQYDTSDPDINYIHVPQYTKNLSPARLRSHLVFVKKISTELRTYKPDLIYAQIPPNSLAKACTQYKKKSGCKLVFDLIDMWPESFPAVGFKRVLMRPVLSAWRRRRDKYVRYADLLITECELYQKILRERKVKLPKTETVYLGKDMIADIPTPVLSDQQIDICYLGAINHIIDIPKITELLGAVNREKKVCVHIIGDGESRDLLIDALNNQGIQTEYFGALYDPEKKAEIFSKCHFGLNIMKEHLAVGLTIKSLDYFQAGLPVINGIKGDTWELIEQYACGINVSSPLEDAVQKILCVTAQEELVLRENTRRLFSERFANTLIQNQLEEIIAFAI